MQASVTLKGSAPALTFLVNGHPVPASRVEITADCKSVPVCHVTLPVFPDIEAEILASITLDSATISFLKSLGWKAPE